MSDVDSEGFEEEQGPYLGVGTGAISDLKSIIVHGLRSVCEQSNRSCETDRKFPLQTVEAQI